MLVHLVLIVALLGARSTAAGAVDPAPGVGISRAPESAFIEELDAFQFYPAISDGGLWFVQVGAFSLEGWGCFFCAALLPLCGDIEDVALSTI